jgi:hypothetical protein
MMRSSTGLALVAIGAVLALAVQVPLTFLHIRLAGLILVIVGLTGLRAPQRACRWLCGHRDELCGALDRFKDAPDLFKDALDWFTEPAPPSPRVPLDDLLQPGAPAVPPASRRG